MNNQYVEFKEGGYRIAGTRVSLDSIVLAFLEGLSPETIATECFPVLMLEQVYGAITFYLANRQEIDAYLQKSDKEFESLRTSFRKADPTFSRKLKSSKRKLQTSKS